MEDPSFRTLSGIFMPAHLCRSCFVTWHLPSEHPALAVRQRHRHHHLVFGGRERGCYGGTMAGAYERGASVAVVRIVDHDHHPVPDSESVLRRSVLAAQVVLDWHLYDVHLDRTHR